MGLGAGIAGEGSNTHRIWLSKDLWEGPAQWVPQDEPHWALREMCACACEREWAEMLQCNSRRQITKQMLRTHPNAHDRLKSRALEGASRLWRRAAAAAIKGPAWKRRPQKQIFEYDLETTMPLESWPTLFGPLLD